MVMQLARQVIDDHQMIEEDEHVLVAVSGGIDSIVLLHVLRTLSNEQSFTVSVGHINHGLRGEASERDSRFVQDHAATLGLPFLGRTLTPDDLAAHKSHGREGAARNARLDALKALADEAGATRIALGHSLDDHAETILYHLARGAGPTGLRGIAPVRLPFIRPLIGTSRADIHAYAVAHALVWREDATNTDVSFARNRIRHHILPELRLINPRITDALSRNADLLADLDEASGLLIRERLLQAMSSRDEHGVSLTQDALAALPNPVLRLLLREGIRHVRGHLEGMSLAHIEAARELVHSPKGHGDVFLPNIRVRRQGEVIEILSEPVDSPDSWCVPVDLGETQLPDRGDILTLKIESLADVDLAAIRTDPWVEAADADAVNFPLHARTRQPGDRFAPLGLGQTMKLKDFLINESVPYYKRDRIPLLSDRKGIIWVAGIRLSDTVKLSDRTKQVLVMKIKGVH